MTPRERSRKAVELRVPVNRLVRESRGLLLNLE